VIRKSGTGGCPSEHAGTVLAVTGVCTDVLLELLQAGTAHRAKIHGRERTKK